MDDREEGQYDLRTERFHSREGAPVELLGQTLMREFVPLATSTTQFNYSVEYGTGRLAPLRHVRTIEDYVAVAEALAVSRSYYRAAPSPIQLPTALDYLGLVLDGDDRWEVEKPTVRLDSVADAAALGQTPGTQAEFDRQVSVLWNILGHLKSPSAPAEAYGRRGWKPESSGSINNLEIWLGDVLEIAIDVRDPLPPFGPSVGSGRGLNTGRPQPAGSGMTLLPALGSVGR